MNIFSIKNRSIFAQSLFFAAYLCAANSIIASEKTAPLSSIERIDLNLDNPFYEYPSIKVLEKQPEGIRYGVCHNYAISKKLGLKGQIPETLPIVGAQDWHEALNFTKNYCEEVSTPQPGDLVTYYPYNRSLLPTESINNDGMIDVITRKLHDDVFDITHTGIVYDNGLVESKWGTQEPVLVHPTFHVPAMYGNHVKYHRITKPTNEIIKDIKQRIPNYTYNTACAESNNQLVKYAEQSDNFNMWDVWQRQMCLNVEASNNQNQSLLMIGAKNNNLPLVKTALAHGADLNRKDKNGKKALRLAKDNNHSEIIQILKEQKQKNQPKQIDQIKQPELEFNKKPFMYHIFNSIAQPSNAAQNSFWETTRS